MNIERVEEIPIACSLPGEQLEGRREDIADDIRSGLMNRIELADGYEFTFPGTDEWAGRLLQFITFERKCCPFFLFELSFAPGEGAISLRLRGPEGTKQFIESMF